MQTKKLEIASFVLCVVLFCLQSYLSWAKFSCNKELNPVDIGGLQSYHAVLTLIVSAPFLPIQRLEVSITDKDLDVFCVFLPLY